MATERAAHDQLDAFVDASPKATYVFDGERGAKEARLCRARADGTDDCVTLSMYTTQLFAALQARGFYCALPSDPARTHLECKPQSLPRDRS